MTRLEEAWTVDLLTAFAPPTEPTDQRLGPLPGEVDYLQTYRRMRRLSTPLAAFGLRAAVWLLAWAPLWQRGRARTFSGLQLTERSQLLGQLLVHRNFAVRELALLLKLVAAMALLGATGVRARSGYDNVRPAARAESGVRRKLDLLPSVQPAADGGGASRPPPLRRVGP
ncbi:MAG TPA: hypothetical protein VF331_07690 [Polyangiales bacterium]